MINCTQNYTRIIPYQTPHLNNTTTREQIIIYLTAGAFFILIGSFMKLLHIFYTYVNRPVNHELQHV